MPSPDVSIVIDNFEYVRYLKQCIESALAQTYPRTDVVVVDDASRDGSWELIRGYGSRVRAVQLERNGGQAAAFNAGFQACRGEVIIFLDSDDFLYPSAAATVAAAWQAGLSKVHYRLDLVDQVGRRIDLYPPPERKLDGGDVVPLLLAQGSYQTTVTSGNAFARRVLEKVLPIPEDEFRMCADGYLVTVAPFHGQVGCVEVALGAYRQHGQNAWAHAGAATRADLPGRLRRGLLHDTQRYRALRAQAGGLGLEVAGDPGLRDPDHLAQRLGSLCLAPAEHPHPRDRRAALGLRGVARALRSPLPTGRRLALGAWFLAAGFLPRASVASAVHWYLAPSTRPPALARLLKPIRRLLR